MNRAERKEAVLHAAAEMLATAQVEWAKGLTFDDLERATGLDRSQISGDFGSKEQLIDEVITHCLAAEREGELWHEMMVIPARRILADRSVAMAARVQALGDLVEELLVDDNQFRSQMTIWAWSDADAGARAQIRELYRAFDQQNGAIWTEIRLRMVEEGYTERPGISHDDMLVALSAVVDGLLVRAGFSPDALTRGLTGQMFIALVESAFRPADDCTELGERLPGTT